MARRRDRIKNFKCEYKGDEQYFDKYLIVASFDSSEYVAKKRLEMIMRCAGVHSGFPISASKRPFDYPNYYATNQIMEIGVRKEKNQKKWEMYAFPYPRYMGVGGQFYIAQRIIETIAGLKDESDRLKEKLVA